MAKLSKKEIDSLVEKVRGKYREYSKKYGMTMFSEEKFNQRYLNALRLKADIEQFLYAEVCAIEEIKKDIEVKKAQKKEEIEGRKKVRKQLDDIANTHAGKIEKYPDYNFHPDAPYEIKKLYGSLILYYDQLFGDVAKAIFSLKNMHVNRKLNEFEKTFDLFCRKNYKGMTKRGEDFILLIQKYSSSPKEYERYEQLAIKEAAILLNDFNDFLKSIYRNNIPQGDNHLKERDFIKANCDFISKIIEDFRLIGFKKTKSSLGGISE